MRRRFTALALCSALGACGGQSASDDTGALGDTPRTGSASADPVCSLPIEPGPCRAAIPAWGHDTALGACREFTYGGCEGNANRFEDRSACAARCNPTR